jgi:hypothetical protein
MFSQQRAPWAQPQSAAQEEQVSPCSHFPFPQQGICAWLVQVPLEQVRSLHPVRVPSQPVWGPFRLLCWQEKPVFWLHMSEVQGLPSSQVGGHSSQSAGLPTVSPSGQTKALDEGQACCEISPGGHKDGYATVVPSSHKNWVWVAQPVNKRKKQPNSAYFASMS